MKKYLVVTAYGTDRPGIVESVTSVLLQCGGNVEESRMVRLGGEFAAIILISLPVSQMAQIRSHLDELKSRGLQITIKETTADSETYRDFLLYRVTVEGADHEGIIHGISHYLSERGINIGELESSVVNAPMSGDPLFSMRARVQVPPTLSAKELKEELLEIGANYGVDIEIGRLTE